MSFNANIVDNFLSDKEIKEILDFISTITQWHDAGDEFWKGRVIDCKSIYDIYDKEIGILLYEIKERIKKQIQVFYNLDKPIYADCFQIIRWFPGMEQPPHADDMSNVPQAGEYFNQRKFGSIIYLNQNYIGGHTFYPELNIDIKPKSGKLVIHPGDVEHTHGVSQIQENIRYTIASFWTFNEENNAWQIH